MVDIIKEYNTFKENKKKEELLKCDFDELGWDKKKEYLKHECDFTCQSCNEKEWLSERIPLEVDHIDGDNSNNIKTNLRVLCPNCHALTDNWRGRNKTNKKYRISNEDLLSAILKHNFNFRQALKEVGLTPKGGNYNRCHKIKREYEEMGYITNNKVLYDISKETFTKVCNECSNYREVSEKLNISHKRVRNYSLQFNLKIKKKEIPPLDELLENYKKFGSFVQLALFYNMSDNGVRKWFKKHGVDPKKIKELLKTEERTLVC